MNEFGKARASWRESISPFTHATDDEAVVAARAYIAQLELRVAELETRLRSGRGRSW